MDITLYFDQYLLFIMFYPLLIQRVGIKINRDAVFDGSCIVKNT